MTKKEMIKLLTPELSKKYKLDTKEKKAMFLAQIAHESNHLKTLKENLNYSALGLLKTFKKYFTLDTAKLHAMKPSNIANIVYGNRMGNGGINSGDGYKFRGRGAIQLTGRSNYEACQKDTGLPCLDNPDILSEPKNALLSALWFWRKNNLASLGGDIMAVTKRINGGLIGLEERKKYFNEFLKLL